MRTLGLVLLSLGFVVGAYATCFDRELVSWPLFVPALAAGVLGVVLARLGSHREARSAERTSGQIETIRSSLDAIAAGIRKLDGEKDALGPYDVPPRIDAELREELDRFAEARETIAHVHGLEAYAQVMSHFAAGERFVNRAWSAGIDGWIDEVRDSLGRARQELEAARERFLALG